LNRPEEAHKNKEAELRNFTSNDKRPCGQYVAAGLIHACSNSDAEPMEISQWAMFCTARILPQTESCSAQMIK